jgi:hypothetical protein
MPSRLIASVAALLLASCMVPQAGTGAEDSYKAAAAVAVSENTVANSLKRVKLTVPAILATKNAELVVAFIVEKREEQFYREIRSHLSSTMPAQCERINESSCCSSSLFVRFQPVNELGRDLDWLNTGILCGDTNREFEPGGTFSDAEFEGVARTIQLKRPVSEILVNATGANDEWALAALSDGSLLKLVFADLPVFGNTLTCQTTVRPSCNKVTQSSLCSDPSGSPGRVWLWNETKSKWCKSSVECGC